MGYSQSNGLTAAHQETLLDDQHEHPHELQEYFVHMGRQLNFSYENDKSIAKIEHIHNSSVNIDKFDPFIFEE